MKHKIIIIVTIVLAVLFGMGFGRYFGGGCAEAAGLYEEVSEVDLTEKMDYKKITLHAWVHRARKMLTRRRDGYFTELVVGDQNLIVVTNEELSGRVVDTCFIIQGVYRTGGRFGGFLQDKDFIIAKVAIRDFVGKDGLCR